MNLKQFVLFITLITITSVKSYGASLFSDIVSMSSYFRVKF